MTKEEFCKNLTVLCDTREQRNQHLLQGLSELGVRFRVEKLDFGDYSFELGKSYAYKCCVERKAHLTELAGNLVTPGRDRFRREFEKACTGGAKVILIVEDAASRHKMILRKMLDNNKELTPEERWKGTWRSNLRANAMIGSLKAWKEWYGFDIVFCDKKASAAEMIQKFYEYYCCYAEKESVENGNNL